ncbi:P-type ATPase (P-ATPase) Superfamily [Thraustotheca clavata]|uniref:P-type ATPase (P-ATPase) Superfamily n=1 Tax=Thraustotheca clavata TaxID=74557 RepID=A0A1V9ZRI0_9STRA|nr:P-type ATPase (P-ATPase) Superfamily [Thraustotheca clavata]
MIQSAHVGIGICGQEGVQAVNASDYAIAQFRFLERLLLVHGRYNYKRIAKVILYSFYKNMSLVIVLFFFNFYNGESGTSLFESFVMAGWNFFLALPIISIGVFDQDVLPEQAVSYPPLYITGQKNADLNVNFWVPLAIVPAYTTSAFHLQGTTIYSGLLMTMNGKVILETLTWTWYSYSFVTFSLLLFFFFLGVYPFCTFLGTDMLGVTGVMLSSDLYWDVFFLIPVACLLVDVAIKFTLRFYYPKHADILRERASVQRMQTKVSCGVADIRAQTLARSVFELTPGQREADEKAGVRNLNQISYTGFAYSSPDEDVNGRSGTGREIATMRVEMFKRNSLTDIDGRTTSLRKIAPESTGSTKRFLPDEHSLYISSIFDCTKAIIFIAQEKMKKAKNIVFIHLEYQEQLMLGNEKQRLNPMELKRERMAKRQKLQAQTATQPESKLLAESKSTIEAPDTNIAMDMEAKMSQLYAKTRVQSKSQRNALGVQYPTTLETKDILPLDWTLKSKLSILTTFPFPERLRGAMATRAFNQFHHPTSNTDITPTEEWHAALNQYVHPATGMPNQSDNTIDDEFITQRLRDWQDAFRRLYYLFHHTRKETSFFVITAQYTVCFYRRPFNTSEQETSLFPWYSLSNSNTNAPPTSIRDGIAAVVSHSTSSFRRELVANGIEFATPFSRQDGHAQVQGDAALLKELHVLSKYEAELKRSKFASPTPTTTMPNNQLRGGDSLLLFHGPDNIHGLYDMLLNQPLAGSNDVAALYANFPFQNASVVPLKVHVRGKVHASSTSTPTFKIDVEGVILPDTLQKLTRALEHAAKDSDNASIVIHPDILTSSSRLNVCGFDAALNIDLPKWLNSHENEIELMKRFVHEIRWSFDEGYQLNVTK